jgi:hypothetical protein
MLVLNKQAALDRMITLAERQSESVPEPFTLRPVRSLLGLPPAWDTAETPALGPFALGRANRRIKDLAGVFGFTQPLGDEF